MKSFTLAGLSPRNTAQAARVGGRLTLIAAAITALFAIVYPQYGGLEGRLASLGVPAALVAITFVFRKSSSQWSAAVWVVLPVLGVMAVAALDLMTHDASAAGQVFLCYPMLYAASQLRMAAAAVTVAAALVAEGVIVFALLPAQLAVTNLCYVSVTLVAMAVLLVRGADAQEQLVGALRAQAAIDPLTGLVTRRVLDEAAGSALAETNRGAGTALILIDVDRFKTINDTFGHPVGDAVLVHLAAILVASSRADSVSCRMGGDELAILLPSCSREAAVRRARHFLEAIRAAPLELPDGTLLAVSVSLGVAHVDVGSTGLDELYRAADEALYKAKRQGRGLVAVATPRELAAPGPREYFPVRD